MIWISVSKDSNKKMQIFWNICHTFGYKKIKKKVKTIDSHIDIEINILTNSKFGNGDLRI